MSRKTLTCLICDYRLADAAFRAADTSRELARQRYIVAARAWLFRALPHLPTGYWSGADFWSNGRAHFTERVASADYETCLAAVAAVREQLAMQTAAASEKTVAAMRETDEAAMATEELLAETEEANSTGVKRPVLVAVGAG